MTLLRFSPCLGFQQVDYNVSRCGFLWLYPTWSFTLLGCVNCFSLNVGSFWPLFFKYYFCFTSFSSPSRTPIIHMLVYLIVSHRLLRLCLYFFILFSTGIPWSFVGSVPDEHNTVNIIISESHEFFGLSAHIKVMFTLFYSLLSVQ